MNRRLAERLPRFLKEAGKRLVNRYLNIHRGGDKQDILILSSPRSGSTWLMELLYAEPGMKYIYEPLGKKILDYHDLLPIDTRWYWITLTDEEKNILGQYFREDGKISHFGPRNFFSRFYNFRTDRRVIKIIRANSIIRWFAREFDFEIIYLIRHPLAQSLSSIKRGHSPCANQFLENELFVHRFLNEELVDYANDVFEGGSKREKFVLEWCLDNLVPLKSSPETEEWLTVSYEELVLKTEAFIKLFCDEFELETENKMLEMVRSPSKTSDSSDRQTRSKIRSGDDQYLIRKWRNDFTEREIEKLFEIVERFGITAYQPGQLLPRSTFLHHDDTR